MEGERESADIPFYPGSVATFYFTDPSLWQSTSIILVHANTTIRTHTYQSTTNPLYHTLSAFILWLPFSEGEGKQLWRKKQEREQDRQ